MEINVCDQLPLGRIFGVLTKKYIGFMAQQLKDSPIERYFYPLYVIGTNSGKISQQQLATLLFTDKVSIVRIVDSLEKEELIERKINPQDRRQHLLCLTKKAEPWIAKIEAIICQTDNVFISCLDEKAQENFKSGLMSMMQQVKDLPVEDIEVFYSRINKKKK